VRVHGPWVTLERSQEMRRCASSVTGDAMRTRQHHGTVVVVELA
jgi:hypothetical protein